MNTSAPARKWRRGKLKDLVFFQRGFDITQAHQRPGTFPVISSSGITSVHDEFRASGPGVVIGRKGTIGSIHFSEGDYWPHDTTLWSKDLRGNNARFVYYYLHTVNLKRFDVGNSNPTLNRNHIHDLSVLIPPRQVQNRIADVLSAYDDLIENNQRRMALLEDAARQTHIEWFDRLRFPGHEHTEVVRGTPDGWQLQTLGDICTDIRETALPETLEPDTPYIGLEHMPRRSISLSDWGRAQDVTSTKHVFHAGDFLFGKIRPYFHKVGVTFVDGVASSDAIVVRPHSSGLSGLVLMTISSDAFIAQASQTMREGSKMPRADWKLLKSYPVAVPPEGLRDTFNDTIGLITEQLKTLTFQIQKLRIARDLLLPRLMSGALQV